MPKHELTQPIFNVCMKLGFDVTTGVNIESATLFSNNLVELLCSPKVKG